MIKHITTDELKTMTKANGIILQGSGGDPADWLKGINIMFTEIGILQNGDTFKDAHVFQHNGLTNIMFDFENVDLDMGKLAGWRLHTHDVYAGTWMDDYLANALGVDIEDSRVVDVSPRHDVSDRDYADTVGEDEPEWNELNPPPIVSFGERRSPYRDEGTEGMHSSDMDNYDTSLHPIGIYIEKLHVPENDGFIIPLPTSSKELFLYLEGLEISDWQDIAIMNIQSDIKGLDEKLQEIIAQESMSPYRLNELNYLAERIKGLDEYALGIFSANIEAGRNCNSLENIINLTFDENLNCFDVQPALSEEMYGEFHLEILLPDKHADAFNRLMDSDEQADRALATHILMLEKHVDKEALGRTIIQEEGGVITDQGYLTGGDGLQDIYKSPHDIPIEHRIYSPPMPIVENADLSSLLVKMHALGGEYMQRAERNLGILLNRQGDELLLLTNGKDIHLANTASVYLNGTEEHNKWKNAELTSTTRAFAILPANNGDKFAIGSVVEIDFIDQQRDIINNSIWFEQVEAVRKNGTELLFTRAEWDSLQARDIADMVSWRHIYEQPDISVLANHLDNLQNQRTANVKEVSADGLLADLNISYMERAKNPQPNMLRIPREVAAEVLPRGDADVYRLFPDGAQQMSPIDAVKSKGLWFSDYREFAIKRVDIEKLDKWVERKTSDIVRQAERGQRSRSGREEEL